MIRKGEWKNLFLVYILLVLLKVTLSFLVSSPSIFADEYLYTKLAQGLFENGEFLIHGGETVPKYLPLYPLLLSISFIFQDFNIIYAALKAVNALLSTLVIFPTYILARQFISKKKTLIGATIVCLLASNFNIANYIMAENLFFPLFLVEIALLYFAFKTHKTKYFLFSGIVLAALYWTKANGLIMVPIAAVIFLFHRTKIWNMLTHYGTALILVIPLLLRNFTSHSTTAYALTGGYGGPVHFLSNTIANPLGFANWFLLYLGYTIIASGIVFGIYYFYGKNVKNKEFKLLFLISFVTLMVNTFVIANQANGSAMLYSSPLHPLFSNRPIGRYIDPVVTLTTLIGFITLAKFEIKKKALLWTTAFSSLILVNATQLTIAPLFPVNNQALTFMGTIFSGFQYIIHGSIYLGREFTIFPFFIVGSLLFLSPIIIYLLKDRKRLLIQLGTLFIIITTVLAFSLTVWLTSNSWSNSDQAYIGHSLAEYSKGEGKITVDERYCTEKLDRRNIDTVLCDKSARWSLIPFWTTNDVTVDTIEEDTKFYVTKDKSLEYDVVLEKGEFIVYEI